MFHVNIKEMWIMLNSPLQDSALSVLLGFRRENNMARAPELLFVMIIMSYLPHHEYNFGLRGVRIFGTTIRDLE